MFSFECCPLSYFWFDKSLVLSGFFTTLVLIFTYGEYSFFTAFEMFDFLLSKASSPPWTWWVPLRLLRSISTLIFFLPAPATYWDLIDGDLSSFGRYSGVSLILTLRLCRSVLGSSELWFFCGIFKALCLGSFDKIELGRWETAEGFKGEVEWEESSLLRWI